MMLLVGETPSLDGTLASVGSPPSSSCRNPAYRHVLNGSMTRPDAGAMLSLADRYLAKPLMTYILGCGAAAGTVCALYDSQGQWM